MYGFPKVSQTYVLTVIKKKIHLCFENIKNKKYSERTSVIKTDRLVDAPSIQTIRPAIDTDHSRKRVIINSYTD